MDAPPPPSDKAMSTTRLYLGNLPPTATKADIENHFSSGGGSSKIAEIKLMTGFGFVEYENQGDARDAVDNFNGSDMNGSRLNVQFARGGRPRENFEQFGGRPAPRNRRTVYRLNITGIPGETSWQDLKDFARSDGLDVVYSEIGRGRDGTGFVEYETEADLNQAQSRIDGQEFHGSIVSAQAAIQDEVPRAAGGGGGRFRSRSPGFRRGGGYGGGPPRDDHYGGGYDRRGPPGPPRGYGGDRSYRDRSPPPPRRGYEDEYQRGPPPSRGPPGGYDDYRRGGPPDDDYPPPRRGYEDEYQRRGPPRGGGYGRGPPRDAYGGGDSYTNGGGTVGYDRASSPGRGGRRERSPGPPGGRFDGGSRYGGERRGGGGGGGGRGGGRY